MPSRTSPITCISSRLTVGCTWPRSKTRRFTSLEPTIRSHTLTEQDILDVGTGTGSWAMYVLSPTQAIDPTD